MTASPIDTLSAMDELRDAGFDERQARAIIEILRGAAQCSATPDGRATSECGGSERFAIAWIGGCIGFSVGLLIAAVFRLMFR